MNGHILLISNNKKKKWWQNNFWRESFPHILYLQTKKRFSISTATLCKHTHTTSYASWLNKKNTAYCNTQASYLSMHRKCSSVSYKAKKWEARKSITRSTSMHKGFLACTLNSVAAADTQGNMRTSQMLTFDEFAFCLCRQINDHSKEDIRPHSHVKTNKLMST